LKQLNLTYKNDFLYKKNYFADKRSISCDLSIKTKKENQLSKDNKQNLQKTIK